MTKKIVITGFLSALGQVLYISLVAALMPVAGRIFESQDPNYIGPVAFILMIVISVAVTGALILGRPIILYLEGQKTDALKLFGVTLGWLVLFLILAFLLALLR